MAGSSGSLASGVVPYSASISNAFDNGDGAGGGFVKSSSSGARLRPQPGTLLEASRGTELTIEASGEDEIAAVEALVKLVETRFEPRR